MTELRSAKHQSQIVAGASRGKKGNFHNLDADTRESRDKRRPHLRVVHKPCTWQSTAYQRW